VLSGLKEQHFEVRDTADLMSSSSLMRICRWARARMP